MPYRLPSSGYHTPTPSNRQGPSYRSQPPSSQLPFSEEVISAPRIRGSSLRLSPKISQNLFAAISKFEALDSLSELYRVPSLRPAPLQLPRNPCEEGSLVSALQHKRPSTICRPSSRDLGKYEDRFYSDKLTPSEADDVFISPSHEYIDTIKKFSCGKAKKTFSPHRVRSLQPQPDNHDCSLRSSYSYDVSSSLDRKQSRPSKTRSSLVKDMIKRYDGSKDDFDTARCGQSNDQVHQHSLTHDYPATLALEGGLSIKKPPHCQTCLEIPTSRKTNKDKKDVLLTPSSKSAKSNTGSVQAAFWDTPTETTRSNHQSVFQSSKRVFSESIHDPFSTQNRPSISSNKVISPRISPKTEDSHRPIAAKSESSQIHRLRPNCNQNLIKGPRKIVEVVRAETFPGHSQRTSRTPRTVRVAPGASKGRLISEDVEFLQGLKTSERKYKHECDVSEGPYPVPLSTIPPRKETLGLDDVCQPIKRQCSSSKVADIKSFFDRKTSRVTIDQRSPRMLSKSSITQASQKLLSSPHLPHTPPLPSETLATKGSVVAKTATLEAEKVAATESYVSAEDKVSLPIPRAGKLVGKTRSIGDKIKLFESTKPMEEKPEIKARNDIPVRKISNSMQKRKGAFENEWKVVTNDKDERRLSTTNEQFDMVHGVENVEDRTKITKRNVVVNRWSTTRASTPIKRQVVIRHAELDGASGVAADMIVKQVKCGLREPRPVRLVEMERMLWLCREKSATHVYKEKSRVLHSRRF